MPSGYLEELGETVKKDTRVFWLKDPAAPDKKTFGMTLTDEENGKILVLQDEDPGVERPQVWFDVKKLTHVDPPPVPKVCPSCRRPL